MEYKYIIIYRSNDYIKINKRIEELFDNWWRPFGSSTANTIHLVQTDKYKSTKEIREIIFEKCTGSCCVMKIFTDCNVSAIGEYSNEKAWSWIKIFCNDQITEILKPKKKKNPVEISGCEINENKNEIGL